MSGTATEKDLLSHLRRTGRACEVVAGTLVEKPMGFHESWITSNILVRLGGYAEDHDLGEVTGEQGLLRLMPKLVRIPDVSFFRRERFPGGMLPEGPIPNFYPDLAVEVLSENNTPAEIRRKLKEYFLAGTTVAWVVDPKKRNVTVYTAPDVSSVLEERFMPTDDPTAADLLELIEELGGIPPGRVLLKPVPGTATEKDLLNHHIRTPRRCHGPGASQGRRHSLPGRR